MKAKLDYLRVMPAKQLWRKMLSRLLKLVIHGLLLKMHVIFVHHKIMLVWFTVQIYVPRLRLILQQKKQQYVILGSINLGKHIVVMVILDEAAIAQTVATLLFVCLIMLLILTFIQL